MSDKAAATRGARPRIAASSYLNSAPLLWSFARGEQRYSVELLTDEAPARCADMLARGEANAALVPVIEYQRLPETEVVPGVCVGSRRAVRSVVLVTEGVDWREVESVALDTSSRTSAALVEIILREFAEHAPRLSPAAPGDPRAMMRAGGEKADASLLIGDPAMTFAREGLRVFDLAALWREQTGLGFVFAMWMARAGFAPGTVDFAAARDEGVAHVDEIADEYAASLRLPRAELVSYLRDNISYELDEELRAGLELYFRLAHKHGLAPQARPLKFLGT